MIEVYTGTYEIKVTGHAPRPENVAPGNNIVCAAVSALTLTLVEGLEHVARVKITREIVAEGHVHIVWTDSNRISKALVDTWLIGIERIRDSYPGTIKII